MAKTIAEYLVECYKVIVRHCYYTDGTAIWEQQKINTAVIACELDLLVLLKSDFSPLEKIAMLTAKEFWLRDAVELTPIIQLLAQKLAEGLVYKAPKIRAKRNCLLALLNINDELLFDGFESFLESFAVLEIPMLIIKPVLDNHFEGVLKKIDYLEAKEGNLNYPFDSYGRN